MDAIAATVPGLYLTGSTYRGVGVPHCIGHAHATIARLAADRGW
jgi:phytoene dehydrogenase-like protein